jgi:hypothetical protein
MSVTTQSDLPDTLEFLSELRQELLEQYGTIILSIEDSSLPMVKQIYGQHLDTICVFIFSLVQIEGHGSMELMMQVAGLMLDLAR